MVEWDIEPRQFGSRVSALNQKFLSVSLEGDLELSRKSDWGLSNTYTVTLWPQGMEGASEAKTQRESELNFSSSIEPEWNKGNPSWQGRWLST